MAPQNAIQLFEDKKVRTLRDAEAEKWYFFIIDVVSDEWKDKGIKEGQ